MWCVLEGQAQGQRKGLGGAAFAEEGPEPGLGAHSTGVDPGGCPILPGGGPRLLPPWLIITSDGVGGRAGAGW